jgi:hypothetical protein
MVIFDILTPHRLRGTAENLLGIADKYIVVWKCILTRRFSVRGLLAPSTTFQGVSIKQCHLFPIPVHPSLVLRKDVLLSRDLPTPLFCFLDERRGLLLTLKTYVAFPLSLSTFNLFPFSISLQLS